MKIMYGARLLIIALLLSAAVSYGDCAWSQSFSWTMKTSESKGKDWTFTYTYPELSCSGGLMGANAVVKDFNSRIQKDLEKEKKTFLDNLKQDKSSPGYKSSLASKYEVKCTAVAKTSRYASFLFEHLDMRANLAHPDFNYSTINWTTDGKFLTLAALSTSQKQFLEKLSSESGRLLKAKFADQAESLQSDGYAPKAENFKYFCISADGLKIYFSYYQLGPRPLGAPDITIPWSGIEGLLSPRAKELLKSR